MKSYFFGTLRTRFLMQSVLLAGFFVSVSAVRADLITFRYEGELTEVDTPLEGQFSVGDEFGGTYTFESETPSIISNISDGGDAYYYYTKTFTNAVKSLDFSSGSFMALAESGDIILDREYVSEYIASFYPVDGSSVGGYTPQSMYLAINDYFSYPDFSSNSIHPEWNINDSFSDSNYPFMRFKFEEVGSQNSSFVKGGIFSVSLVDRTSTTIVPSNKWLQIGLKTAPPIGSTVADIIGDDISAPYGSEWVVYSYETNTNTYKQLSLTDTMLPGVGYWFIQTTGNPVTIDMPDASTDVSTFEQFPCEPTSGGCFEIPLQTSPTDLQWQMIGYPFRDSRKVNKIKVVTSDLGSDCVTGCTLKEASDKGLVDGTMWHFDGSSYQQLTTDGSTTFNPWDGAWIATLPAASGQGLKLVIPAPNN